MSHSTIPGRLVDAVFRRVLAPDLSEALKAQLKDVGVDVSQPAHTTMPRDVWYRAVELTSQSLFGGDAAAQRKLGRHIIDCLQSRNLLKGPWLTMAKLVGPRRALKQAAEQSAHYSPVALKLVEKTSKEVEVHADDGAQPEFLAGLLEGLIAALGGKDSSVVVASSTPERAVFSATWR